PQGGLSEEQQATARQLALETLIKFRDGAIKAAPPPDDRDLLTMMEYAVGAQTDAEMEEYLPLLEEELSYRGEDRRAPGWAKESLAPGVDFEVLIIGAGMSGGL